MTAREFIEHFEVQSEVNFVYYDYERADRIHFGTNSKNMDLPVRYVYVDGGELYIEVEKE